MKDDRERRRRRFPRSVAIVSRWTPPPSLRPREHRHQHRLKEMKDGGRERERDVGDEGAHLVDSRRLRGRRPHAADEGAPPGFFPLLLIQIQTTRNLKLTAPHIKEKYSSQEKLRACPEFGITDPLTHFVEQSKDALTRNHYAFSAFSSRSFYTDLDQDHRESLAESVAVMTEPPENRRVSFENSGEAPARIEGENVGTNGGEAREVESSGASAGNGLELESGEASGGGASVDNGGSNSPGISGTSLQKTNTLPREISNLDKFESNSSPLKLERAKTERSRHHNIGSVEAAQIFNDKIPVQQKLKLLNRIATVKDDGTVEFEVPGDVEPLSLGPKQTHTEVVDCEPLDAADLPPLQIVMLIVGTRGDVQPFIAIGKRLQDYGHRVRLATHSNFKEFVLTAGLEFYPLGGDPKVLAGYMVKNKGFLPSGPSEIPVQRNQMKDIIYSLLSACKDPDMDSGIPFKAEAIIANPPAYGHTHVAEALKVPIHIFFTMPWTPTSEFPHPLSRVKQSAGYRLSYQIVDSLIWLGIRDMINDVRKKKLKLRPVTYLSGSQGSDSDIPHGYIWSPHLVPKPKDWGPKIDVVGFCFLDLASNYEPPEELVKWLEAGEKPIYIGFGSLPVQEPEKMTQIIVEALERTGQRGIINKGWGGLGNLAEPKDFIYLLDNCPHDWLFLQCKAVVHHGGAGTTAAGLKAACPTTIVPFFGDQPFWGERVHVRGVGPSPIPVDEFSLPKLVEAINFMLDPKRSLKYLLEQRLANVEHQKWLLGYDFEIQYRPRVENRAANALSRRQANPTLSVLSATSVIRTETIHQQVLQDERLARIWSDLQHNTATHPGYSIRQGRLFFPGLVASKSPMVQQLLCSYHNGVLGGHSGELKTYRRLAADWYWTGMKKDVSSYVVACEVCQRCKASTLAPSSLLQPLPVPKQVWEDMSMDFIEGLPPSEGFDTILVVVDRLSKYAHFVALKHPYSAEKVAHRFIQEVVCLHGVPRTIVSDRDCIFLSHFWTELHKRMGTVLSRSTAYHPRSDGQTKVVNKCVETYLRCFTSDKPGQWHKWLAWAEYWYNTSFHIATQTTPSLVVYGRAPPLLRYGVGATPVESVERQLMDRDAMLDLLKFHLLRAQ
ncbi:Sterol 3-beta-glucosyltransferase [Morus notabilis]|uniref:sterol 3beta-glucosyltransferase n=1 Tax=Morus notabilis TaxID=981085 RepID=W9SS30_9ROSA|nr:Sterol 3-beta-glucosyltransferase [Morus notabilis]